MSSARAIKLLKPAFVQRRGERFLMVWPQVPYWMVAGRDVRELVRVLESPMTLAEARTMYSAARAGPAPSPAQFRASVKRLAALGLLDDGRIRRPLQSRTLIETVTVSITNRCNFKCHFCCNEPFQHGPDAITAADVDSILRALEPNMADRASLVILGGEPFLRPAETLGACEAAVRHHLAPLVETNGSMLKREHMAVLRETKTTVRLSLDGATERTNDAVRGPGAFEKAQNAAALMRASGVRFTMAMVVLKANFSEMEAYLKLARAWGASGVRFLPYRLIGHGQDSPMAAPSDAEVVRRIVAILEKDRSLLKMRIRSHFTDLAARCREPGPSCGAGLSTIFLDADGSVYPCHHHCYPVFRFASIKDGRRNMLAKWSASDVLDRLRDGFDIRKLNATCSRCAFAPWCSGGCRAESYAMFNDSFAPIPRCREMKEALAEAMWAVTDSRHLIAKTAEFECW